MILTQAIEAFTVYLKANRRSPLTIDVYRRDLFGLARFTCDMEAESITAGVLHEWLASASVQLQASGAQRSDATIGRCKAATRSFAAWLTSTDVVTRNPALGIEIRRTDRHWPSFFTDIERKRMVREVAAHKGAAAARDHVMLEVLLGTGIRLAELVGLDVGDVDLDGKHITILAKGGRTETRFVTTDLRRLLRHYLRRRATADTDSTALFLSNRSTRISARQVQARFEQWLAWAGIERPGLTVHSTRHTFGTRLYNRTHDLILVGRALGHRTTEATRIYVHTTDEALEEALETL